MANHAHQAKAILAIYLERGAAALALFAAGDDDGAVEMLRLRSAAFHNFRVVNSRLTDTGVNFIDDSEALPLLGQIAAQSDLLSVATAEAKDRAQSLGNRLREARRALGGYRSQAVPSGTVFKSV